MYKKFIIYSNFLLNTIVLRIYIAKYHNIFLKILIILIKNLRNKNIQFPKEEKFIYSGDKGVYLFDGLKTKCVYPGSAFGVAINDERIFLAISSNRNNFVISFPLNHLNFTISNNIKIHYRLKTRNKIHQIAVNNNKILLANTNSNCITEIDLRKDNSVKNYFPFSDNFGRYICSDHNHINAVYPLEDGFLFLSNQNREFGSILGINKKDKLKLFSYVNAGCHDILSTNNEIIFSDSFGGADKLKKFSSPSGLVWNKKLIPIQSEFVRGIYIGKKYILSGASVSGSRSERFFGKAHIKFINQKTLLSEKIQTINCSQIYMILGLSGERVFINNYLSLEETNSFENALEILKKNFGESIYEGSAIVD